MWNWMPLKSQAAKCETYNSFWCCFRMHFNIQFIQQSLYLSGNLSFSCHLHWQPVIFLSSSLAYALVAFPEQFQKLLHVEICTHQKCV